MLIRSAVNDRSMQIDSWLTGSGNLFWHEWSGSLLSGNDLRMTCTSNAFTGQWQVDQGALLGAGTNSLGTNNILVGTNGLIGGGRNSFLYDIHNTNGSLILGPNGTVYLHQNDTFKSVLINGASLTAGTYSFATLNSAYPAHFPSSWTLQNGSPVSTGSGSITVMANPAPIILTQPQPVSLVSWPGGNFQRNGGGCRAACLPLVHEWHHCLER